MIILMSQVPGLSTAPGTATSALCYTVEGSLWLILCFIGKVTLCTTSCSLYMGLCQYINSKTFMNTILQQTTINQWGLIAQTILTSMKTNYQDLNLDTFITYK